MSHFIIVSSGTQYAYNGFKSLSSKTTFSLRTGGSAQNKPGYDVDYVAPQWNPAIDILAVPEQRALRMLRLSGGQTIWRHALSESIQKPVSTDSGSKESVDPLLIRAIAWHPTGSRIAVLHANGQIVHRDPARGDIVHKSSIEISSTERVVDMQWLACIGSANNSPQKDLNEKNLPLEFYLPTLSSFDKSKSAPDNINPSDEPLSVIVVTTETGSVWVSLGGIFALPVVRIPESAFPSDKATRSKYRTVGAHFNADISRLYVAFSVHTNTSESQTMVFKLDTPILSRKNTPPSPLLLSLAALSARLSGLMLYLENTISTIIKEIEARESSASRASLKKVLESILQDHGVDEVTSPEAEMVRLAVTGRASESTAQFLLAKIKSTKITSWENASRLGAVAIVRLIYQNALPAIERSILASARLLDSIASESKPGLDSGDAGATISRDCIARVIAILGWVYGRMDECMIQIREEQSENQEFSDWALFCIDDLQWQNDGPRRNANDGHEDTDGDDGSRPVRPDINYRLLLRFIRSAFSRRRASEFSEEVPNPNVVESILGIAEDRETTENRRTFVQSYFGLLSDRANLDGIGSSSVLLTSDTKQPLLASSSKQFKYVFHSQDLLDSATGSSDTANIAPTCIEALAEVKALVLRALEWPSQMLGESSSWDLEPTIVYPAQSVESAEDIDQITDTHMVSMPNGGCEIYMATVVAASQSDASKLEFLCISDTSDSSLSSAAGNGTPRLSNIRLSVKTSKSSGQSVPISVADIKFFDDNCLGILFTVDGCGSPFLGTVDYRSIKYIDIGALEKPRESEQSLLAFERLLEISQASLKTPTVLAVNGRKGRRCVAVVERRGKYWWPLDMDNIEDEDDDEEEEDNDNVSNSNGNSEGTNDGDVNKNYFEIDDDF
ncbi:hypothetical protein IW150_003073 [Coemansia sp. RSA 2607]|nr:hypothetical protein IW150_003073 [Coemansia sp. RSA 2607]